MEYDITLFAEKIAPKLNITYRFVGEELEDKVTNEYNSAMKKFAGTWNSYRGNSKDKDRG